MSGDMISFFSKIIHERYRNLWTLVRRRNFWIVLSIDIALVVFSHFLAYWVRFDWLISSEFPKIAATLPLLILIKIPIFYAFGLYSGMWRYTSIADLKNITKAVVVSSGIIVLTVLYFNRFNGFSRSVFFMDAVFTHLFLCLHRGTIRFLFQNNEFLSWFVRNTEKQEKKRLLLIGAGAAAEKVIREIRENSNVHYEVVGLVDDDQNKHGLKIHGIPVLGGVDTLKECIARVRPDELLIAVAAASGDQIKRIVEACQKSKIKFKILPSIGEIIKGKLSVSSFRDIAYRDLLGRPVVNLDQKQIGGYLTGKVVLVTGAGGSVGSELCRQIIQFEPTKLMLLDAGEENLYKIQMELEHEFKFQNHVPILGKIQNRELLNVVFLEYKPMVVFHAAAYKHVPLVENNPWEGIFNNVFGTKTLIETSILHGIEKFVLVSTDKAVRPTNVMGATKRLTELLMLSYSQEKSENALEGLKDMGNPLASWQSERACGGAKCNTTTFMAVRFGNVLGSSGSVIPLFKRQIEKGGPVTVTHPEITRYFMSIEEAAQLILQAGAMGSGGEIFLLKMGTPVKIINLAQDLIKLMGYELETEIKISFTGLRPGEKLYEELITEGEGIVPTSHEKIMVLRGGGMELQELEHHLRLLKTKAKAHGDRGIKDVLQSIIPEYCPDLEARSIIETQYNDVHELRN